MRPLRVLQVIDSLILAGAERLVYDLIPRLAQRGVEPKVMVLKSLESPLERGLRERGVPFLPTPLGGLYSPAHVYALARHMSGFDLVHTHLFPAQLWVAIASLSSTIPLVVTEHGPTNRHRKPWFRPFDRWTYEQYARIICNSEATAAGVREWAPRTAPRIVVIPNGIDLARFRQPWSTGTGSGSGPAKLTFIARLEPQKDHAMVLRALARVPGVEMRFVGIGRLEQPLRALAETLGIGDRVRFLGHREDIAELLRETDIYVHCAHSEGFGLAVLEAMASGCPVVATRNAALADVVGDAGVLLEPGDVGGLMAALQGLLASPAERARLGAAGRQRAERFSIDATAEAHVALYNELVRNHTSQP